MFPNTLHTLKNLSVLTTLICSLAACGGGDGYGNSSPESTPEATATPTPEPTPEVTATPEPTITPVAVPLEKAETNAGETFVGTGQVMILISGDEEGVFTSEVSDRTGRTLYVRDNDELGSSSCNSAGCVTTWPPLLADENATPIAPLTVIEREDGATQWALRDKPLYFFSGDAVAGDLNGEGKGGFHIALSQPIAIGSNDTGIQFFVGFGSTLMAKPEADGINDSFIAQRQNVSGLTLYTFANDEPGKSNCFGQCLVVWPALLADPEDTAQAPFSLIDRQMDNNGTTAKQWAYRGKPLYYFFNDTTPGDTNGLANDAFSLVRPLPWKVADSEHGSLFAATGLVLTATPDESAEESSEENAEIIKTAAKDGFTLYTLDDDDGSSTCVGPCLANWPAFMAHAGAESAGPFSVIARESGEMQWALNGKPLYFFVNDVNPGDVKGDGIAGKFHVARTAPIAVVNHETEGALLTAHGALVNQNGEDDTSFADFTLYTFAEDIDGIPTCFQGCADQWPPLFAAANARSFGDFTVIDRNDPATSEDDEANIKQWAYKGEPLYFFGGDSAPGDANGEYGTWFIARP
ncbi:hypothetical protein TDB9533_03667 [Thalassocella blandensis]|nr:hypothetical protein TDB9533_03667 [Thalassocella blandensis]